jgi:hypothetical protein
LFAKIASFAEDVRTAKPRERSLDEADVNVAADKRGVLREPQKSIRRPGERRNRYAAADIVLHRGRRLLSPTDDRDYGSRRHMRNCASGRDDTEACRCAAVSLNG